MHFAPGHDANKLIHVRPTRRRRLEFTLEFLHDLSSLHLRYDHGIGMTFHCVNSVSFAYKTQPYLLVVYLMLCHRSLARIPSGYTKGTSPSPEPASLSLSALDVVGFTLDVERLPLYQSKM